MPEERELSEEEKRLYLKVGLVSLIIAFGIGLPGFWLVTNFVVNIFGSGPDRVSLLASLRAEMALAYPLLFIPVVVLLALAVRWIWKKSSPLVTAAIMCGLSGEFVLILIAVATVFDAIFPGVPVTIQVPLMAVSLGIALLAMGQTAKIRPIRNILEKQFK
jgi:hypothetical protein